MRVQHRGMALSACVLATLAACSQAFTAGGSGGDGGEDASSDSPGTGEGSSGGDAVAGDAGGDGIAHDAVAHDGLPPHDAPSREGSADGMANDVVVGGSKLVFITSALYTGNLGGLDGADMLCQKLAAQVDHERAQLRRHPRGGRADQLDLDGRLRKRVVRQHRPDLRVDGLALLHRTVSR